MKKLKTADIIPKLNERRTTLRKLVNEKTHRQIVAAVKVPFGALGACEKILLELPDAIDAYEKKIDQRPDLNKGISQACCYLGASNLLVSARDLANARDKQALDKIGVVVAKKVAKRLSKLLPIHFEDLEDLVELIDILSDSRSVIRATKLRCRQANAASGLLTWLNIISLLGLSWAYDAYSYILGTQGRGQTPEDDVLNHVVNVGVECANQDWDNYAS